MAIQKASVQVLDLTDGLGDISTGNITTTGYIRGPSTLTIDPAEHDSASGTLRVRGNLTVDGTTTTINSTTVTTADKNIVIAQGAADSAAADGAGITIDTVDASLTYNTNADAWSFNKNVGIGTDAPSDKLVIQTGDDANGSRIQLGNQDIKIIDRYQSSDYTARIWGQWPGYGILRFGVNDGSGDVTTSDLSIRGNGNIGINTDDPQSVISSSRVLQIGSGGSTTISIRSTDSVNDRSAILELLSTGNGNSKSIIIYGDTDTTPSSPSPLSIQSYHSGVRTERMIMHSDGRVLIADTSFEDTDVKLRVNGLGEFGRVFTGPIPDSTNVNTGAVLVHRLGQSQGFQFSGKFMTNSWTGNRNIDCHITSVYTTDAVAVNVNHVNSGNISATTVKFCTVSYGGASYLAFVKDGGGSGVSYVIAMIQNNMAVHGGIREISSGSFSITTTHTTF